MLVQIKLALLLVASPFLQVALGQDCGPANGDVSWAGSNPVQVIGDAVAAGYRTKCPTINVTIEAGTTAPGAERVCANNTRGSTVDIGTLSRLPLASESTSTDGVNYTCVTGNKTRETTLLEVALDGLTIGVVAGGYGAQCIRALGGLTLDQIRWIFSSYTAAKLSTTGWNSSALTNSDNNEATHLWSELNSTCRAIEIKIAGRDLQSGTAQTFRDIVFKDARNGETFASNRPNGYFNSSVDRDVVNFIQTSSDAEYGDAIAYFAFAYYLAEGAALYGAPIKNGAGNYVIPTQQSIADGTYNPLSRFLYLQVYKNAESLADTRPFLQYLYSNAGTALLSSTGYVALDLAKRNAMLARIGAPPVSDVPIPTPAPAGAPNSSPVAAPTRPCGLLGLGIFCPFTFCGFFGRLLGLCND